jgi:hypothetical protein
MARLRVIPLALGALLSMAVKFWGHGGHGSAAGRGGAVVAPVSYVPPDIWSWSFPDGTVDGMTQFIPADEEVVLDSTFPTAIDPTITYSGRFHYLIDAAETPDNIDRNRNFERQSENWGPPESTLDHFYVREWLKLGTPLNLTTIGRKLCYIRGDQDFNASWCVIIGGFNDTNGVDILTSGVIINPDGSIGGTWVRSLDVPYTLPWNVWRGFECEVLLNTPNVPDGRIHLWIYDVNGSVIRDQLWDNIDLRGNAVPLHYLETTMFGNQADRNPVGIAVDEYRYVNRLAISRQRIGP